MPTTPKVEDTDMLTSISALLHINRRKIAYKYFLTRAQFFITRNLTITCTSKPTPLTKDLRSQLIRSHAIVALRSPHVNMSLFNSVLGSVSPRLRDSFEDPHAHDHELSSYRSSSVTRIPPPVASTVLWNAPQTKLSPPPRVPDDLLVIQRKARHLEQQLQELLDAQADGLMSGLASNEAMPDDLVSNGSITPTAPRKKVGLNTARKRIARRIQQLASVKAEELDLLDEDLRDLSAIVNKTETWSQKRTRLEKKMADISSESTGTKAQDLQTQASKLEQEIRQKEEELWALKTRRRRVLNELADTENSVEAKLSTYKASLSYLDKEVDHFLSRPPPTNHGPLSSSPFPTLPPNRRTLEMAQEYWHEEHTRLVERCEEVDLDRAALDEGAVLWNEVVKKVVEFETSLQDHLTPSARAKTSSDPSRFLELMENTVTYLEENLELATQRGWNLLVCAIGAELQAFKQGKEMLEEVMGVQRKGKEKAVEKLVDTDRVCGGDGEEEEVSRSAIRIGVKSPPEPVLSPPPKQQHKFFDTDDEDPDPELMISH
ncbi:hypothetical protein P280DRAFT_246879 [Massarina eburnea CBS 473.64]|uniref:Autophagy-related protein 28 n=1 Tax=Massarina eburnea CBS 473.64 TaxID=1395130 RepID=A0A6A6S9V1_9PLEO|nr:hypothetical protein P280DRAFT_246879 [Massarina eburnea CBS 473.64]